MSLASLDPVDLILPIQDCQATKRLYGSHVGGFYTTPVLYGQGKLSIFKFETLKEFGK